MAVKDSTYLTARSLRHVPHGFFGRQGGTSRGPLASLNQSLALGDERDAVLANRERAVFSLGLTHPVTFVLQEHKTCVVDAGKIASDVASADGLTSGVAGRAIGILTADCVPVLLATSDGQQVLALHAGWRGLARSIILRSVSEWCAKFCLRPGALSAAIGPAIGPCCFDIGAEAKGALSAVAPLAVHAHGAAGSSHARADLFEVARVELRRAGLLAQNIDSLEVCTRCADDRYFSYRREPATGRQAAIIAPRPVS